MKQVTLKNNRLHQPIVQPLKDGTTLRLIPNQEVTLPIDKLTSQIETLVYEGKLLCKESVEKKNIRPNKSDNTLKKTAQEDSKESKEE